MEERVIVVVMMIVMMRARDSEGDAMAAVLMKMEELVEIRLALYSKFKIITSPYCLPSDSQV